MKKQLLFFRIMVVLLVAGLMALSCLNPIGFSPELKLKVDVNATVSGEVGIDSVNSAEIQLRNHTKSIDIYKTEIVFIDNGATPPVNGTAARITGAPVAGTQESILLRPIGPDANTRYVIYIWYRQSASCPEALKETIHPGWDFGGKNPDKSFEITELPRGKYIIHVYRTDTGGISIIAEDDSTHITEMGDHNNSQDYVVDVKVNTVVDLSGASVILNVPSGGLNVNANTTVSFSNEVMAQFNALLDAIRNNRPYPNGHGSLVVRNHTSLHISNIEFEPKDGQSNHTVGFPGVVRSEDQERFILKQGKWEAKLGVDGKLIGPKNVFITNQGKEFLHVYKNKSGGYSFIVSEKEWSGDLIASLGSGPDAPDSSYSFTINIAVDGKIPASKGALYIHNMTTKVLDNPDPGKVHIVPFDLALNQPFDLTVGARATMGGVVDPSNYTVSVGPREISVFVSHMTPTHVYYYKTRSGGYNVSDYWPPNDADQSGGMDISLSPDQAIIVVKNRSGYIIDYFAWMNHEYDIQLSSGDDVSTVVEAGTGPIGFKVRNGNYGEYLTKTINPGQIFSITVEGSQIIDINPPTVVNPKPDPQPVPQYDQTIVFKHETGYQTPIEYLILYRDNGVSWDTAAQNTGYVWLNSGVYYLYNRKDDGSIAPDNHDIARALPQRPSNNKPIKRQWTAAPVPGLDDTRTTSVLEAVDDYATLQSQGKIAIGDLGSLGNYAVKVKGTKVSSYAGRDIGKDHAPIVVKDSIIIQFDPPLQKNATYEFKIDRGSRDHAVNWFVSWVGANHDVIKGIRYNAGYFGDCWFILCPWYHDRGRINMTAKGVALRYE